MSSSLRQAKAVGEVMGAIQSAYPVIYEASQRVRATMQGTASEWNDSNRHRYEEQIAQSTSTIDMQANQLQELMGPLAALKQAYEDLAARGL